MLTFDDWLHISYIEAAGFGLGVCYPVDPAIEVFGDMQPLVDHPRDSVQICFVQMLVPLTCDFCLLSYLP
jgi:hypothetical protein